MNKSVKFVVGKPAYNISSELNKYLKQKKDIKKKIQVINNLIAGVDSDVFSKDLVKSLKSKLYQMKYVLKRKIQLCSKCYFLTKKLKKHYNIAYKTNVLIKYNEKN